MSHRQKLSKNTSVLLPLEAEFAIACACMGFSDSALVKAHLLAGKLDCKSFLAFAEIHGLMPLIYCNLLNRPELRLAEFPTLETRFRTEARRSLLLTRELFRVLDVLSANGIACAAHKGPALSSLLYGDPGLRTYIDIDVLVMPEQAAEAKAALLESGWKSLDNLSADEQEAYIESACEFSLRSAEGILVELQWGVTPSIYAVDFDFAAMIRGAAAVAVAGRPVKTLAADDLLLALAVHGAKHMWSRLSWVIDIGVLVQNTPLDWAAITRKASLTGTRRIVGAALIAASEICCIQFPDGAKELVAGDAEVSSLAVEMIAKAVAGSGNAGADTFADFAAFGRLRERRRDRLRMLTRLAFTPSQSDWSMIRLPRYLFPFYVFVRAFRLGRRAISSLSSCGR